MTSDSIKISLPSLPERLTLTGHNVNEGNSHIRIHHEAMKASGYASILERICPAHVYRATADGDLEGDFAGCLECGTCLAIAPHGTLEWEYPAGSYGVTYHEG